MADKKVIPNIIDNYIRNEKNIVNQLYFTTSHGATIGGFREDIWKEMFRQIIPGKFAIEQSVFIIDSEGSVSNEVDLAIFDETYTPYIFRYGRLKFLPIEAVAVVVECKSSSINKENLTDWERSIEKLKTSNESYARIATGIVTGEVKRDGATQTATRPLRILCKLTENVAAQVGFDIEITAVGEKECLEIVYRGKNEDLRDWYLKLNHDDISEEKMSKICDGKELESVSLVDYQVKKQEKEVSLMSFNFQLNQLLMLINNPMLFPHMAYAKMFNKYSWGGEKTDE